ncbi:uncharacterized protein conserved in bacteria [Hahella chejuensis KCTC 2396]|uniref:Uncharacterized protein conserved in bacteria n=2 Tax=Hahella chejuensis TaxID=158327 RepID=Q2SGU6_HAHCH|nr:uncharacterized protein conserved in bacteria [Hahella chejuensis KCTC 2396]
MAAYGKLHRACLIASLLALIACADVMARQPTSAAQAETLLRELETYRNEGRLDKAVELANNNPTLPGQLSDRTMRARLWRAYGALRYATGQWEEAESLLTQALTLADDGPLKAAAANDLGLVKIARREPLRAIALFKEAYAMTSVAEDLELRVRAGMNLTRAYLDHGQWGTLADSLASNAKDLALLGDAPAATPQWLRLGRLYLEAGARLNAADYRLRSFQVLQKALAMSRRADNKAQESYALGYIGQLYEQERRVEEALDYTRRALFAAQEVGAEESLYLWQWRMALLLRQSGDSVGAVRSYRQAIASLNRIQSRVQDHSLVNFREVIRPLYYGFADMMLARSAAMTDAEGKQSILQEVMDALESMKLAEVENHFNSECMALPERQTKLTEIAGGGAVFYPVSLADRTELIVLMPDGARQFTLQVNASELQALTIEFRTQIEAYSSGAGYLAPAQKLYSLFIEPVKSELQRQNVSTLIVVPDASLRTIPFAALHNGQTFLIEQFAIATTPGMTLTEPAPFQRDGVRVLAGGLAAGAQGFAPIPGVAAELRRIEALFPARRIQDKDFVLKAVKREIAQGEYSIVHLATHAEFNSDHTKSFLLTYDGRLTLDSLQDSVGLRRYTGAPLDLLVLSACQTAVGDDQAALGLAGVAIKAGARSALATLWFINDRAASQLIGEFYAHLNNSGQSKAEALRKAQVSMLSRPGSSHPSLWAPFLLIGAWM